MKLSVKTLLVALSIAQAGAFTSPRPATGRVSSSLDTTTLEEWQILDNGSVVGSVRSHPTLNDGDIITTSPLSNPSNAKRAGMVTTLSGSMYKLGSPMQLKAVGSMPRESEGGFDRREFGGTAALTGLFAAGVGAGVTVSGMGEKPLTIPEAKIQVAFPKALSNAALLKKIEEVLKPFGYGSTSLVATSLCCDEVNRPLENELAKYYDEPFVMGGLAGFPFGGITSFGAMAHHIPDGGSCLIVYGPHVGVDTLGTVGKINRRGRTGSGSCCGSAAAALGNIRKGAMVPTPATELPATDSLDAQQAYVNAQLAPYGERLLAADDRNVELPYALFDAQRKMMDLIVDKGVSALESTEKVALLGGIQINCPDGISDYFLPLSFEIRNSEGKKIKDLMWA